MKLIGDQCNTTHILYYPTGLRKKAEQRAKCPWVLNKKYLSRKMVNSRQQKFAFCRWPVSWTLLYTSVVEENKFSRFISLIFLNFFFSHKGWPPNIAGLAWVNSMCGGNSNSINAVSYAKKYELHCFCLTMSWNPLEYYRQSQRQSRSNRGKRSISHDLIPAVFPRFRQIAFLTLLSLWSPVIFPFFWLAVVITICLDLQHSNEILPKVAPPLAFSKLKLRW